MVYASEVDQKKLTFQVSGKLWKRSLVMRDLETKSLWSHILGECMEGELKGKELELVPGVMMTWKEWLADHPGTTVLDMSPTAVRFDKELYEEGGEFVYGVKVRGRPKAYTFGYLEKNPVVQEEIAGVPVLVTYDPDSTSAVIFGAGEMRFKPKLVDGQLIEEKTGSAFHPVSGTGTAGKLEGKQLEKLAGIVSYRRAWKSFYPKSEFADAK